MKSSQIQFNRCFSYIYFFIDSVIYLNFFCQIAKTDKIVYLKIKRTSGNRRRCTISGCENRDNLHNVPRKVRFKMMKERKIYIPREARACDQHLYNWDTMLGDTDDRTKFNTNQIEDMVELLCDSRPRIVSEIPGECSSDRT